MYKSDFLKILLEYRNRNNVSKVSKIIKDTIFAGVKFTLSI